MPPKVKNAAFKPLCDALEEAWFGFGDYDDWEETPLDDPELKEVIEADIKAARTRAMAAMAAATKPKAAAAEAAAASGAGQEEALHADDPLVPSGWPLPPGMQQVWSFIYYAVANMHASPQPQLEARKGVPLVHAALLQLFGCSRACTLPRLPIFCCMHPLSQCCRPWRQRSTD